MVDVKELFQKGLSYPYFRTVITVIILFVILNFLITITKRFLLSKVKRKKQRSNVEIFSKVLRLSLIIILVVFAISSYEDSWAGLGLGLGLFSAALGWALQKPITGIAAWIMVVIRRPFEIGDRVIIGSVKGDVVDISLTHIFLQELGGIVGGEESSGRIIMVPNSNLFDKNIVNYTSIDDFILDQVIVLITFESNLNEAIKIANDAALKVLKPFLKKMTDKPFIRTSFQKDGIEVSVRYLSPATSITEYSSKITQEIFNRINETKKVTIAYPHLEILMRNKKEKKISKQNKLK